MKLVKNWLVTGDKHGDTTWLKNLDTETYIPEETAIVILGDTGLNFYLDKSDKNRKKKYQKSEYTFYLVYGNHEMRPEHIKGIQEVYDDNVEGPIFYEEDYPNIKYFLVGYTYTIAGHHTVVAGGAYSVDKFWRLKRAGLTEETNIPSLSGWWADEQISQGEQRLLLNFIMDSPYQFDLVLSHTCPYEDRPTDLFLDVVNQNTVDNSEELFLSTVKRWAKPRAYAFGHYHDDRQWMSDGVIMTMLFNQIIELEDLFKNPNDWSELKNG